MDKDKVTVGEFLDVWLRVVIKNNSRDSTYVSYKGYVKNHIKRHIGSVLLKDLKPIAVQEFVSELVSGGKLSARTVGIIINMLKQALGYAQQYELIRANPCLKIRLPKIQEKGVRAFSATQQAQIEKAVLKSNDNRSFGILLVLYTGIRIGELCALRWDKIDFYNNTMKITRSLKRVSRDNSTSKTTIIECEPKTKKSRRTICLPDFLRDMLKKLKSESNSDFVISMKSGKFVDTRTMQMLYKKLLESAGVEYSNFHTLRHTFATRAAELNTDPKTVSETLGHSSVAITLNLYTHSLKEQKQKMMRELDNYFKQKKD
ncbi:MAG: site-specific integrase [Firmicutes bacterium]|nr:site-specific integrase [Bacillota bacterium]